MATSSHPDSPLIDKLGGASATARICRVTSQAVSQWRRYGIPEPRRMYLQLLRPDVFGDRAMQPDQREAA